MIYTEYLQYCNPFNSALAWFLAETNEAPICTDFRQRAEFISSHVCLSVHLLVNVGKKKIVEESSPCPHSLDKLS